MAALSESLAQFHIPGLKHGGDAVKMEHCFACLLSFEIPQALAFVTRFWQVRLKDACSMKKPP